MAFASKTREKEYQKEYRLKNKEILLKKKKEYYNLNKVDILEKSKNRYSKEEVRTKNVKYSSRNKLKISVKKKVYRLLNIDKIKNYKNGPRGKLLSRIHCKNRRRKMISDGTVTISSIENLLIKQNYKCAITGCDLEFKNGKYIYHIDHIIPISKGGIHAINNLQITTPVANLKKYNSLPY